MKSNYSLTLLLVTLCSLFMTSCNMMYSGAMVFIKPSKKKSLTINEPLAYDKVNAWFSHPLKLNDPADGDVNGFIDKQSEAKAAVFFIHPTSYFSGKSWNKQITDSTKDAFLERMVLPNYLKIFNGSFQVYAPKYQQATLAAFITKSEKGQRALTLATDDLEYAFDQFINQIGDKPFILAGHSQGSYHVIALLKRKVVNTPLEERLIAAIVPGYTFPVNYLEISNLNLCLSDDQLGCIETWNVLKYRSILPNFMKRGPLPDTTQRVKKSDVIAASNPLITGYLYTENIKNAGAWLVGFNKEAILHPAFTSAEIDKHGYVRIHKPDNKGFRKFLMGPGWYHQYEYALFWVNIRARMSKKLGNYFNNGFVKD